MDIWDVAVGGTADLGVDTEFRVVERLDERGTVSIRLRGTDPGRQVVAELRRSPRRPPAVTGYLTGPVEVGEQTERSFMLYRRCSPTTSPAPPRC